jgi:phosphoglycolate phosphatase-like HAD superfamily hydrolase
MFISLLAFALQASASPSPPPPNPEVVAEQVEQAETNRNLAQTCIDRPADYAAAVAARAAGTQDPSVIVLVHYETARAAGLAHCNGE